jgi:hypothetical protein
MLKTTRRFAVATIVLPAVLAITGCSSTDTPAASPSQGSASAANPSTTSSSPTATAAEAPGGADKDAFIAALKAASSGTTSAHVEMVLKADGQTIIMSGDTKVDAKDPAMQMTMDMGVAKLDMILVDKVMYMQGMPGLEAGKWVKLDVTGEMGRELEKSLEQADPTKIYQTYERAITDVKLLGDETVDGEVLHQYQVTMDTKELGEAANDAGGSLPDTVAYTMWLDDEDHVRQVTYSLAGVDAEMKMSRYGEPVNIKAPIAADVVEMPTS